MQSTVLSQMRGSSLRRSAAGSQTLSHKHAGTRAAAARLAPRITASVASDSPFSTTSTSGRLDAEALRDFKVLVAGATGGCGRKVVETLVAHNVPVRALVRDLDKARSLLPSTAPGGLVELVKGDVFQFSSLPGALGDANAVICATGANSISDPLGPFNVDFSGTANLVALAKQRGLRKFVLITSIGTDDLINPLNLFWGVLFWKKRGEEVVQRSGLDYTIVRPGGLKNELKVNEKEGNIIMRGPGYWGVPPKEPRAGSILRRQVAEVCVSALYEPAASGKVVEIVAEPAAPKLELPELFAGV